uniref:Transmembrane protein n=1 Tax=Panagrellus redivivus TaxID=6233 RepID=A0A7E4UXM2_PANRE
MAQHPPPGNTKLSIHSGSGTLRGGGVKRIYGNMASLKQYKHKIDYRLPLVTIVCLASIASILFLYGLYQLKGHDNLVEYVKSTRDIAEFIENPRHKRQFEGSGNEEPTVNDAPTAAELEKEIHDAKESEEKVVTEKEEVTTTTTTALTTTSTTTTTTTEAAPTVTPLPDPNWISASELRGYYDRLISTYETIWNLFALNLVALLFLIPATIIFHLDYCGIAKYKIIFRIILGIVMVFLFIQLLYLISPVLSSAFAFPEMVDRLFDKDTEPKHERGVSDIKENFACDFDVHPALIEHGIEDPCLPKIKDSLFPSYATILLIFLDILPFLFAGFTYAWDAWLKDCTAVREARMRVELNQKRPQARGQNLNANGNTWTNAETIQVA